MNLSFISRMAPELIEVIKRRYNILRTITVYQPLGRRTLSEKLQIGERIIRNEVDFLKQQGLLEIDAAGMRITPDGAQVTDEMREILYELLNLAQLERKFCQKLSLEKVIIVPGELSSNTMLIDDLGKAAGFELRKLVADDSIIAVTGGTTLASVAKNIPHFTSKSNVQVIAARGGLGETVEIQANTIAAKVANKLSATYKLLHVPDFLTQDTINILVNEPHIQEVLALLKKSSILIHGIGVASEMAGRRGKTLNQLEKLSVGEPVGEAFGYYFSENGDIVSTNPTLGLKIEDLNQIPHVIAVAGGSNKANAILSVLKKGFIDILITDEGAAKEILERI